MASVNTIMLEEKFKLMEHRLEADALIRISLKRVKQPELHRDQYAVDINFLREKQPFSIEKYSDSLRKLIPTGSMWAYSLGWYSYFGIPFIIADRLYIAAGIEAAIPRSEGTAHLNYLAYVYEGATLPILASNLKFLITPDRITKPPDRKHPSVNGIIQSQSTNIKEHEPIANWVLEKAVTAYAKGEALLFRTVALTEQELYFDLYPCAKFIITVPEIEETFDTYEQSKQSRMGQWFSDCKHQVLNFVSKLLKHLHQVLSFAQRIIDLATRKRSI